MVDYEKVTKGLEICTGSLHEYSCSECPYYNDCTRTPSRPKHFLLIDAFDLLKEQEQEINRLKHNIDCDAAEKWPGGCAGYGRSYYDDEPCETCKVCEKYNGYGEE